ncbi:MAG: zeta toxin family protein [Clostridiales bacterium]|jgi:predicted ABC-type ATPase|nr:zeta toxin family protein [Clostridiales bacterium]
MKIYTIIAGVNGVGKSSLSGVLKSTRADLGCIIDPDRIAAQNSNNALAGKIAVKKIRQLLSDGVSFTQETTLSGGFIKKTVKAAHENGYFIRLFYIGLNSSEESVKRIKNRVQKGGHNIPSSDVLRRFSKRFADLKAVLVYCQEGYFYDNENGFLQVGEYRNGEFIPTTTEIPEWYNELQGYF